MEEKALLTERPAAALVEMTGKSKAGRGKEHVSRCGSLDKALIESRVDP